MFETVNYRKLKRKKRLIQKNHKKIAAYDKYEKNKRHIRALEYDDQYLDAWELINSR